MKANPTTVGAVVVGVSEYGEAHLIVDLLTADQGLVRAFAASARKSRRRFGGALQPGTRLQAVLQWTNGRDLAGLREVSVETPHRGALRTELSAMLRAGWMLDLSRSLAGGAQPSREIYEILNEGLEALDQGRLPPWGLVAFEVGALATFGAVPRFDACCACGTAPKSERARFSPASGGLACPSCFPGWGTGDVVLSRATLRALNSLSEAGDGVSPLARAEYLPEAPDLIDEARLALGRCTEYLLGRPLRSREIMDQLGAEQAATGLVVF